MEETEKIEEIEFIFDMKYEETNKEDYKMFREKEMPKKIGQLYRICPRMFDEDNDKINWIVKGKYKNEYFEITDCEEGIGFVIHYKKGFEIEEFKEKLKKRLEKEKPKAYCYVSNFTSVVEMICYPKIEDIIEKLDEENPSVGYLKSWFEVLQKQNIFG